jgi:hypothetical protein
MTEREGEIQIKRPTRKDKETGIMGKRDRESEREQRRENEQSLEITMVALRNMLKKKTPTTVPVINMPRVKCISR